MCGWWCRPTITAGRRMWRGGTGDTAMRELERGLNVDEMAAESAESAESLEEKNEDDDDDDAKEEEEEEGGGGG